MCLGGNSANTDRKQQLEAYGDLGGSISKLNKAGNLLSGEGQAATGQATKYYSDILSGDPNRVAAAMAPQAKAQEDQSQQLLKQIANFGNRGGGTNQVTSNLAETNRGNLIAGAGEARQGAASGLERIGATETGQGLGADTSAASVASALLSGSTSARSQSQKIHDQAIQNWANLVTDALTGQGALTSLQNWGA